jgi:PadR family transcriptional regulator PadR
MFGLCAAHGSSLAVDAICRRSIVCAVMRPPLQEPTFFILTALTGKALHGYGLIQAIRELSGQRITLSAGTLYPALDRLAQEGIIAVAREEVVGSRLRRYYELTDAGAARLAEDVARLTENVAKAGRGLGARNSRISLQTGPLGATA